MFSDYRAQDPSAIFLRGTLVLPSSTYCTTSFVHCNTSSVRIADAGVSASEEDDREVQSVHRGHHVHGRVRNSLVTPLGSRKSSTSGTNWKRWDFQRSKRSTRLGAVRRLERSRARSVGGR